MRGICISAVLAASVQLRGTPAVELPQVAELAVDVDNNVKSFLSEDSELASTVKDAEGAGEETVDGFRIRLQAELAAINDENNRLQEQAAFAEKEVEGLGHEDEQLKATKAHLQEDNVRLSTVLQGLKQKLMAKMGNLDATLQSLASQPTMMQREPPQPPVMPMAQAPAAPQADFAAQAEPQPPVFAMPAAQEQSAPPPQAQATDNMPQQPQAVDNTPQQPQATDNMPQQPQAADTTASQVQAQSAPAGQQGAGDFVTVGDFLGDAPQQKTVSIPNTALPGSAVAPPQGDSGEMQPAVVADEAQQAVQTAFLQTSSKEKEATNATAMTSLIAARRLLREMANRVDQIAFQEQQVIQKLQTLYGQARAKQLAERQAIVARMRSLAISKAALLQEQAVLKTTVARMQAINAALRSQLESFGAFLGGEHPVQNA
eukprot:CAMPEP_0204277160 /NCGR_PEP_ID=MMETSP0468-20130131/29132_1 /ASSEMBLY_ACC=CAM_ASM_000383 /TAXON_ID=2969 /ORGANISM="Oxyrrhis marina" /LENGTH=430 /DNA_ID=CAMNT_0051253885 /DNA_START=83 /DNA_END=1375 /DNA_ORIENTATION=-